MAGKASASLANLLRIGSQSSQAASQVAIGGGIVGAIASSMSSQEE
jgi:hypothetical protein